MVASETRMRVNAAYSHLREYGPRFEILYGGAGSGKSYGIAQHIVLGALDPANRGRKYLCVRKVARTLRFSVFALLRDIISEMGLGAFFTINRSEMTFTSVTGCEIILLGLDDVEKLKSIHGVTDVWGEEATEFARDDIKQLNLRLRGPGQRKRIVLSFNPIMATHWLKKDFFDNARDNVRIVKTTYRDNAFLDDEYRAELESLKDVDEYFYQVYALGEWGQLGNLVFTNYVIEDFPYTADDLENVRGGIDFGYNHPSAIARVGFKDGEIYIFDEFYQSRLTNTELIDHAKEFDPEYQNNLYRADSAEPDRIEEFAQAGFAIEAAKKGKDSIRHGVDYLKRYRVHIHATRCPNTAAEWQGYKYREDRDGNVFDEPVDLNNHGIDAVRYATEDLWADGGGVDIWIPGYESY